MFSDWVKEKKCTTENAKWSKIIFEWNKQFQTLFSIFAHVPRVYGSLDYIFHSACTWSHSSWGVCCDLYKCNCQLWCKWSNLSHNEQGGTILWNLTVQPSIRSSSSWRNFWEKLLQLQPWHRLAIILRDIMDGALIIRIYTMLLENCSQNLYIVLLYFILIFAEIKTWTSSKRYSKGLPMLKPSLLFDRVSLFFSLLFSSV